jgi:hypothetical protein
MVGKGMGWATMGDSMQEKSPHSFALETTSTGSSRSALHEYLWGYLGHQKAVTVCDQQPTEGLINAEAADV